MRFFVIYDPAADKFYDRVCGKLVNLDKAKRYKRLSAAISGSTGAGLMNTRRSENPVVVREYENANHVATHTAPPWLIEIAAPSARGHQDQPASAGSAPRLLGE